MKVEQFLFGLFVATVVCFAAVALIVVNLSPEDAGLVGLGALFASTFAGLVGVGTLASFYLRRWRTGNASYYDNVTISLRRGVLLATALTGLLILQALRVLTPLSAALFVAVIFSSEFYLRGRVRR